MRWRRWPNARATLSWCRPQFVAHPCIEIEAGRHPVVEMRLRETGGGEFIANHCRLDARTRMLIITGPNMGGKSTYMRQVALIVLLAAMGSLRARQQRAGWGRSTPSTPASARPTTWRTRSPPSCWR